MLFLFQDNYLSDELQSLSNMPLSHKQEVTCGDSKLISKTPFLSYERASAILTPEAFRSYCGLIPRHFEILYELVGGDEVACKLKQKYDAKTPVLFRKKAKITLRSKLFLTLVRLRRNYALFDISQYFALSEMYSGQIFYTWVRHLYLSLQAMQKVMAISAEKQSETKPDCFKPFPNLRMIFDSVDIGIERFGDLRHHGNCFSSYKHSTTVRLFLGISCHGAIIYISEGYEGSISDKDAFLQSNIFEILQENDVIMVDRGFGIKAACALRQIKVLMPPKLGSKRKHFTEQEELMTKAIAKTRIYVEHIMKRLRDWRFLNGGKIDIHLVPILPDIVYILGCLYNFESIYIGVSSLEE